VTLLRISELSERSGVPSSTLRYYERIGLVEPLGRAENGYRLYDPTTLDRLAFIGRAKRLGMRLEDVATLVEAWFAGECEPLQGRLRLFITGRIAELRTNIADDSAFERQLERILIRLDEAGTVPERCGPDCGCDTDPLDATGVDGRQAAVACSLDDSAVEQRVVEWQVLLAAAVRTERAADRLSAVFEPSASVVAELARLSAAETACCPFFTFNLDITAAAAVLTVRVPAGAEAMLDRLVGAATGMVDAARPGVAMGSPGHGVNDPGFVHPARPMSRIGG